MLIIIPLTLQYIEPYLWEDPETELEMVSAFGFPALQYLGIPSKISKITYLHVFHLIILLILAGQLFTARRHRKERQESYLSWMLAACLAMAMAYSIRSVLGLWGEHLAPVAWFRIGNLSIQGLFMGGLSLLSSFSFLMAGLAARFEVSSKRDGLKVVMAGLIPIAVCYFAIRTQTSDGFYLSVPIAATSVTACLMCGHYFYMRAIHRNRFLAITLAATFWLYSVPQFMEPLTYHKTFIASIEPLFIFSFLTKTVVFLAVVTLALAESYSDLETVNRRLGRANANLKRGTKIFSDLLKKTNYAYFVESVSGKSLRSTGEQEVLGLEKVSTSRRETLFEDPETYRDLVREVSQEGTVRDRIVKMRHSDDTLHSMSLSLVQQHEDGETVIQGLYHDVTASERKKEVDEAFGALLPEIANSSSMREVLGKSHKFLERILDASAELYFAAPNFEPSSPPKFIAGFALGHSTSQERARNFPPVVGDHVLNLLRGEEYRIIRPSPDQSEKDGYEDSTGLRDMFSLFKNRFLALLPLRPPFPSDFRSLDSQDSEKKHELDGIVFVFFDAEPTAEQVITLDVLSGLIDQLLMASELAMMNKLMEDAELLWTKLALQANLHKAIRHSLRDINQDSDFDCLMVTLVTPEDDQDSKAQGPLILPSGPLEPSILDEMASFIQRETDQNGLGKVSFPILELTDTTNLSLGVVPLTNEKNLCNLIGLRKTKLSDTPVFNHSDQRYLNHLASYLSALIVKFEANHAFRLVVGRIGHDLQAPIVAVKNRAHYLINEFKNLDSRVIAKKLEDIKASAIELQQMSGSIDFFRKSQEKSTKVDLYDEVIHRARKELDYLFKERGASQLDVSPDLRALPPLHLPKTSIERIVRNLIVNMAKYGRDELHSRSPTIDFASTSEDYLVLFSDWGPGIDPDEQEKIFEEGYRGKNTSETEVTGSGLGLFIARALAEAFGGKLELTSARNPTEFRLHLPKTLIYGGTGHHQR